MPEFDLTDRLADLHQRRLRASDLLEQALDAAHRPAAAHAYCLLDEAAARAQAALIDARLDSAGIDKPGRSDARPLGRLAGAPVSIKDLYDVQGQVTCAGSTVLANDAAASADAPAVARLRQAGAVLTGRTQMSEFAFSGVGINPHQGTPANATLARLGRRGRVPGGSTSGGAVSVAAGAAWAALGSDTGGSIRIPAALHGLVGFKNSQTLTPADGSVALAPSLDTVCAITTSVRDAVLLHDVLAARPVTLAQRPLAARRCAIVRHHFQDQLDASVQRSWAAAIDHLGRAGLQMVEIDLPELADLPELTAHGGITSAEAWQGHAARLAHSAAAYDPRVVLRIRRGAAIDTAMLAQLHASRRRWISRITARLQGFDAVLSPTVPIEAPPIADLLASDDEFFRVNALLLRNPAVVNLYDGCSISLPCEAPGDWPVGLMLWAGHGQDDTLLDLALAAEAALARAHGAAPA
jgi:amidase/aspartyl-tRNA(Asn)/glutamyl-tRNA(Gln) amidotransferase subunit A